MSMHRGFGTTVAVALTVAACATTVRVPEIPILEGPSFKAANREPDPKPPVKIVEVPKPLPLPGQLKPVPEKKEKIKDEKEPKERVKLANADARVEPAKDGYINAIQVYPYTKGALYQLYAPPPRSATSRSSQGRSWSRSRPATPCAGSWATPPAARARRHKSTSS